MHEHTSHGSIIRHTNRGAGIPHKRRSNRQLSNAAMLASTMSHLPRKRPHNQVKKKKDFFVQTRQPVNGVATLRNVVGQRATCYSYKAQSWTRTSLVTLIDLSHRTHEPPSFIHPSFRFFHTRTSEFTSHHGKITLHTPSIPRM